MNLHRFLLLVSSSLLALLASPRQALEFRPREGSELSKSFETKLSLGLDDLTLEVNGEEIDPAMFMGGMDLDSATVDAAVTMEVRDTYVRLGEDRPLELLRAFESMRFTAENGLDDETVDEEDDELVGHTVRFEWDADAQRYARSFEGETGGEENLDNLAEDMDLRDLLPRAGVESGDTWEVRWVEHLALVMPGFDLTAIDAEDIEPEEDIPAEFLEGLIEALQGVFADAVAKCTFQGMREVDGAQLAVVEISSEIDVTLDLLPQLDNLPAEVREHASFDRLDLDLSLELTGELLWDAENGHFHSLDLGGPLSGTMALEASADQDDMEFSAYASAEFSGELARSATAE